MMKQYKPYCNERAPEQFIWRNTNTGEYFVKALIELGQHSQAMDVADKYIDSDNEDDYGQKRKEKLLDDARSSRTKFLRNKSSAQKAKTKSAEEKAETVFMQSQMMDDQPASKRSRTDENLTSEGEFLACNPGPVTIKISVPSIPDKPNWKCDGQIMSLTLALTETVEVVKAKIMEDIGMPQGKQKLQHESIFLKDANSLAYYNIGPGTVIKLHLRQRGGRKK